MFTTRPEITGTFGAVTSTHWLASASGMAVLERGGNAFDAAVAAAFVLQVVEPHLNGPGGDVPLIFGKPGEEPVVLCGQGTAPAGATIEHYRSLGLETVPGTGLLAPAVPGSVHAWLVLLRDHGTMRPREVLDYAIGYAADGHPALERVSATIASMADFFTTHWPTSAQQWLADGRAPERNELLRNPAWARTLERLCDAAEAAGDDRVAQCDAFIAEWTTGFVADAIAEFVQTPVRDSSGRDHAGVITGEDLAAWQPTYESPVSLDWRGVRVYKCGLWSQGPALLQQLALLDGLLPQQADEWDADLMHAAIEAASLAFADRDAFYGDSGEDRASIDELLDPAYTEQRRALIGDEASHELRPGSPGGRTPRFAAAVRARGDEVVLDGLGEPTVAKDGKTRGDTCHIDVVDRWGNVVSATPSGGWLQSSPYIPDLGFCLGSRLQMMWVEEGLPSSLQPGRRPRTTLSPSLMVEIDTDVTTAFGTPGGDQQDQWQLVFLLANRILGRDLQASIDAPSWHVESLVSSFEPRVWQPGVFTAESRIPDAVIEQLRQRGHLANEAGPWSLGRMSAASYEPSTGLIRAAANPRGMQGYAAGR